MRPLSRRAFLRRSAVLAAAGWSSPWWARQFESSWAYTLATTAGPAGTTLEATIVPAGQGPYVRLAEGPGWPFVLRAELAEPKPGREERRRPLAAIVQLTDVHVIDAQSPARVEFLDRFSDPPTNSIPFNGAFRAQEVLTTHVAEAMVRRINALPGGPVTGRPFDCAVSTGDNIDNQQQNELDWFLTLLDGGLVEPDSGGSEYEGVQGVDPLTSTHDAHYWHPDLEAPDSDNYKRFWGFPAYPGLLAAAAVPFTATGLKMPWFSTYGNHDGLLQGNAPVNPAFEAIATGPLKVVSPPAGFSPGDFQAALTAGDPSAFPALLASAPSRAVTPDERRRIVTPQEYVTRHLDHGGHGFTEDHRATGRLYFTFAVAPGVLGIALDTVNRGGYAEGSIGRQQMDWLEARLEEVSSRWFDAAGGEMRDPVATDQLVVLFSHHNLGTMTNPFPDPAQPDDERLTGEAVEAVLHRYPNVVMWVNGHSHVNRIWAHPDPSGRSGGFWEVNTAAHVDYPEHARLIELVDNRDGTLSIFATLIEHAAPARTSVGTTDPMGLAAISRELAVNEFQDDPVNRLGALSDRNVELLVRSPFTVTPPAASAAPITPPGAPAVTGVLPATGGTSHRTAAIGAAAAGAAFALRPRPQWERDDGS